jgi:hypothetical protein
VTSFGVVAPLALMAVSINLVRKWVIEMLGTLADDDDHNARLRGTLAAFLQENGSYRAAAERLTLHKNTVQYRIRKPNRASAVPRQTGTPGHDGPSASLILLGPTAFGRFRVTARGSRHS